MKNRFLAAMVLLCQPLFSAEPQPNPDATFHAKPKELSAGAITQDWPCFLGPAHNSVSTETHLLTEWPAGGPALVWEAKKGTGYSSPVIANGRLILFHRVGDSETAECLDAETGRRFWKFEYPTQYADTYGYNNGPRASPIIDGERVYTFGAAGLLHCLKLDSGEVIWKKDIVTEYKLEQNFFGVGATPLIEGNLLIVNVGAPEGPCVAAFNKETGALVWGSGSEWGPSYATPIPADVQGKRRIFVLAGGKSRPPTGGLLCIDPANGKLDFRFPWRSKSYESVNAASPVIVENKVFITASYDTGGALIEVQPDFSFKQLWTTDTMGCHFTTPIHKEGYLYSFDGRHETNAQLSCAELKTGRTMWQKTLELEETLDRNGVKQPLTLTPGRGQLLWVDGHYLCLGETGHLLWLDLAPKGCTQLSRAWLFVAQQTWTPPIVCKGLLYTCQNERDPIHGTTPRLLCYDLRK